MTVNLHIEYTHLTLAGDDFRPYVAVDLNVFFYQ